MKVLLNRLVSVSNIDKCGSVGRVSFCSSAQNPLTAQAPASDEFVRQNKAEVYQKKLDELFTPAELQQLQTELFAEFKIDNPPKVRFLPVPVSDHTAGGFTFSINTINLALGDFFENEYKMVGIKDGKKSVLFHPTFKMPLFTNKEVAEQFIETYKTRGNFGFDELTYEAVTKDDLKKSVVHKLCHEVIHAQQHQVMRSTQGIGEKGIFAAWTHITPKSPIVEKYVELLVHDRFKNSYWGTQEPSKPVFSPDSVAAKAAKVWLEAIRSYNLHDDAEYRKNPLERDAYERSYQYVVRKFGGY